MDRDRPNFKSIAKHIEAIGERAQLAAKYVNDFSAVVGREARIKGKVLSGFWHEQVRASRLFGGGRVLSSKEKDLILHGMVVSILILPMLVAPFFGASSTANAPGGNGSLGLTAAMEKARARYALLPSRGTAQAQTDSTVTPAPPAPAAAPAPAPAPAPVPAPAPAPDPNSPPALTNNTQNLNPVLLQRFDAFRSFIFVQYHVVLEIKSGWRSYEEQAQLYNSLPRGMANPPGKSRHESGNAIDYTPFNPTYNQHLAQFGLWLPYPGKENWHVEPR